MPTYDYVDCNEFDICEYGEYLEQLEDITEKEWDEDILPMLGAKYLSDLACLFYVNSKHMEGHKDIPEIAEELDVETTMSGTFLHFIKFTTGDVGFYLSEQKIEDRAFGVYMTKGAAARLGMAIGNEWEGR